MDISIGTWRGLAAHKSMPTELLAMLGTVVRKCADEPALKDGLKRLSMGWCYADTENFRANMSRDNDYFKGLVGKLGLKA